MSVDKHLYVSLSLQKIDFSFIICEAGWKGNEGELGTGGGGVGLEGMVTRGKKGGNGESGDRK